MISVLLLLRKACLFIGVVLLGVAAETVLTIVGSDDGIKSPFGEANASWGTYAWQAVVMVAGAFVVYAAATWIAVRLMIRQADPRLEAF